MDEFSPKRSEVYGSEAVASIGDKSLAITVLCGGPSNERQISLQSGLAIATALESAGHNVKLADIMPDNLWALDRQPLDLVFIALHGQFGEDGQVQKILENRGIAFCGSDSTASSAAFDKYQAKLKFIDQDIPTPAFDILRDNKNLKSAMACWSLPVVIKPVKGGSSLGVKIIEDPKDFEPALADLLVDFQEVLIEQYIPGKELTVSILGSEALPIIEVRTDRQFYDYQAKYQDNDTQYLFDIDIEPQQYKNIQDMAMQAARCLSMRDFCRVDLMLGADHQPYILEINTIPGFTAHSLLPKAAERAGMDMTALCSQIVEFALTRSGKPANWYG